ncbi:MAG TPA: DoxX family membrane protein [Candidatus Saccharimonadales bacterium]|nr:DoxX family membrane protein [Candidatus Saccharimonadales bacterium]
MAKLHINNPVSLLLRLGLAIVFLYAAVSAFLVPDEWVGYLPQFMRDIVPADVLLPIFSIYELTLAVWLLSGLYVKYAALLVAATLAGIVAFNFQLFAISFRDIALIFAAVALYFEER